MNLNQSNKINFKKSNKSCSCKDLQTLFSVLAVMLTLSGAKYFCHSIVIGGHTKWWGGLVVCGDHKSYDMMMLSHLEGACSNSPVKRKICSVSFKFRDILGYGQREKKTFQFVKINVSHSLLPYSSISWLLAPLLLLQLELVLFLMDWRSATFEKVPCHQLHVKLHFTYLKDSTPWETERGS